MRRSPSDEGGGSECFRAEESEGMRASSAPQIGVGDERKTTDSKGSCSSRASYFALDRKEVPRHHVETMQTDNATTTRMHFAIAPHSDKSRRDRASNPSSKLVLLVHAIIDDIGRCTVSAFFCGFHSCCCSFVLSRGGRAKRGRMNAMAAKESCRKSNKGSLSTKR